MFDEEIDREWIAEQIGNGEISYSYLTHDEDKKLIMLTEEQIKKLVQLSVLFGITI